MTWRGQTRFTFALHCKQVLASTVLICSCNILPLLKFQRFVVPYLPLYFIDTFVPIRNGHDTDIAKARVGLSLAPWTC